MVMTTVSKTAPFPRDFSAIGTLSYQNIARMKPKPVNSGGSAHG